MAVPILAIAQLGMGIYNMVKSKKRPKYEIPGAQRQHLAMAKAMANRHEMPGQSNMHAQVAQQAANALSQSREYGQAGLASLPAIMARANTANLNIGTQAAGWRDRQMSQYLGALGQFAGAQNMEWQMNKFAPYADRMQRGNDMFGAGVQNMSHSSDQIIGLLAALGGDKLLAGLGGSLGAGTGGYGGM